MKAEHPFIQVTFSVGMVALLAFVLPVAAALLVDWVKRIGG